MSRLSLSKEREIAARLPVEHRLPAGDHAQPGCGCGLRWQSGRLVHGPTAGYPVVQWPDSEHSFESHQEARAARASMAQPQIWPSRTRPITPFSTPDQQSGRDPKVPALADPSNVYPGFPSHSTLAQALRPYPQWYGVPSFLGPPMGDTWYDSLQIKVTKRYSHGLTARSPNFLEVADQAANSNTRT